jgi:transcriptional regulator with XRE-family HTH domain
MDDLIRKARILKGYSQEEIGDMMGMSQSQYSKMETSGSGLDLNRIQSLAKILEIDVTKLISLARNGERFASTDEKIWRLEKEKHGLEVKTDAILSELSRLKKSIDLIYDSLGEDNYDLFRLKLQKHILNNQKD